jgi:ribA/ribD-fused uncharacterized protein
MINEFRGKNLFLSSFFPYVGNQREPVEAPAPILWKGKLYTTREHLYQAAKTTFVEEVARIRNAETPALAKTLGKRCTLRPGFNQMRLQVMEQIITAQYTQHPFLALRLLRTEDQELVEGNRWGDTFWGVDLRSNPPQGQNHLGKLQMKVRRLLQHKHICEASTGLEIPATRCGGTRCRTALSN